MKETVEQEFCFDTSIIHDYVPPEKTGDDLADAIDDLYKYREWKRKRDWFDDWFKSLCKTSGY